MQYMLVFSLISVMQNLNEKGDFDRIKCLKNEYDNVYKNM